MDARAGEAARAEAPRRDDSHRGLAVGFVVLVLVVNALAHGDFLEPAQPHQRAAADHRQRDHGRRPDVRHHHRGHRLVGRLDRRRCAASSWRWSRTRCTSAARGRSSSRCSPGSPSAARAGWINALPVVRLDLPPFITTLAMMQVARGLGVHPRARAADPAREQRAVRLARHRLLLSRHPGLPGDPVGRARDGRRRDRLRGPARAHGVRALRARARRQRGGGAARRHRHRARQDARVRDLGRLRGARRACC